MNLRCIIIDDEADGVNALRLMIEKHVPELKVVAFTNSAVEGISLIEDFKPELVFLDINMPEIDGFGLLQRLNWRNFNLIFVTAYQEFGLKALKQNAFDYLLKPVDRQDLRAAFDRVIRNLKEDSEPKMSDHYKALNQVNQFRSNKISLNSKHGVEYVESRDISHLESRSNYTTVHLTNLTQIVTPKKLGDFETQLCVNSNFMRVHKSYIVNLHKVSRYLRDADYIIMTNNSRVPLSKSRKPDFLLWLEL